MPLTLELSNPEARRIALAAQGFAARSRSAVPGVAQIRREIGRLGLLQIDSVNVLVRAHYMPLFSRLGTYDRARSTLWQPPVRNASSSTGATRHPSCRSTSTPCCAGAWNRAREGRGVWDRLEPFARERRAEADALLARIEREGPLAASEISGRRRRRACGSGAMPSTRWNGFSGRPGRVDASTGQLRARVRPARARAAPGRLRPAHPGPSRRPAGARRAIRTGARHRDGERPPGTTTGSRRQTRAYPSISSSRKAFSSRCASAGGSSRRTCTRTPGPDAGIPARPSCRRSIRSSGTGRGRAALRLPVPTGDLHARPQARAWLLRAAVPHGRRARCPLRPEGGPQGRRAGRPARAPRAGAPADTMERLLAELDSMASWLGLSDVSIRSPADPTRTASPS